jgi:hypothetical protein
MHPGTPSFPVVLNISKGFAAEAQVVGRQMTLLARMSEVVEPEWLGVDSVRVGSVPASSGTPARYVTVAEDDKPILRIDVYAYGPDCFAFQDAIVWRENVIVGFGSHVHAISVADRSAITIALESYFGHVYPTRDYLLLASGDRLFRMEPDR